METVVRLRRSGTLGRTEAASVLVPDAAVFMPDSDCVGTGSAVDVATSLHMWRNEVLWEDDEDRGEKSLLSSSLSSRPMTVLSYETCCFLSSWAPHPNLWRSMPERAEWAMPKGRSTTLQLQFAYRRRFFDQVENEADGQC